jgi:hypothetical protein
VGFSEDEASQLLSLNLRYGSLIQSIQIAESLADKYSSNPDNINNLAYFNFLLNRNLDQSLEISRNLTTKYPAVYSYKLTLALGLLKNGRTNEASRLIDDSRIELTSLGSRGKMIYAAILAANGQEAIARGLVQNIDMSELIPEEAALIESL